MSVEQIFEFMASEQFSCFLGNCLGLIGILFIILLIYKLLFEW